MARLDSRKVALLAALTFACAIAVALMAARPALALDFTCGTPSGGIKHCQGTDGPFALDPPCPGNGDITYVFHEHIPVDATNPSATVGFSPDPPCPGATVTIEQQDNVVTLLPGETVPPGDRIYEVRVKVHYPSDATGGQTPQVTVVMQFDRPADATGGGEVPPGGPPGGSPGSTGPCPPNVAIYKDMKEGYLRDEDEAPTVLRVLHPGSHNEGGATIGNTGVGAPFEYLLDVSNDSDCPAHVVITDHVPPGLKVTGHDAGIYQTVHSTHGDHQTFDKATGNRLTGASGHPAADGGFDEKFVVDLEPHDAVTIRIHVTPQVPGSSFINQAHSVVTGQGPVDSNNTELEVTPMPEVSGVKASGTGVQGVAGAGGVPSGKSDRAAALRRDDGLSKVQVAVLAARQPGCRWLRNARGRFTTVKPGPGHDCSAPVWITARGTRHWQLKFRHTLPRGRYLVYSRALNRAGVSDVRAKTLRKRAVKLRVR